MPSGDIWADRPAATPPAQAPTEPAPPWFWDVERLSGNAALRRRDGSCVLVVIRQAESWGIYQLQLAGEPNLRGDWRLLQIRGDRDAAITEALAGARRAGLIEG